METRIECEDHYASLYQLSIYNAIVITISQSQLIQQILCSNTRPNSYRMRKLIHNILEYVKWIERDMGSYLLFCIYTCVASQGNRNNVQFSSANNHYIPIKRKFFTSIFWNGYIITIQSADSLAKKNTKKRKKKEPVRN